MHQPVLFFLQSEVLFDYTVIHVSEIKLIQNSNQPKVKNPKDKIKQGRKSWQKRSEINLDVVYFNYKDVQDLSSLNEVYIWDLDKTYLDTSVDSLKGLFMTIFEKSFSKKNMPGASALLRSLARYRRKHFSDPEFPLFFVSASPPQMESKIYEKFTIDEIDPLGMFYKDNLRNLRPSRFTFLRNQIGYKIQALLQLRVDLSPQVKMLCFGDDSESDVVIYNLFSDICARRMTPVQLSKVLEKFAINTMQIEEIIRLQDLVPVQDPVEKIYINLATDTDPEYYGQFGRRTLATYDSFQLALDFVQDQRLSLEELSQIIIDLKTKYNYGEAQILRNFEDLIRRRVLGISSYEMIRNYLMEKNFIHNSWTSRIEPMREKTVENGHVYELEGIYDPWIQAEIDYLSQ